MPFTSILIATDLTPRTLVTLPVIAGLVARLGADVTVAYADADAADLHGTARTLEQRSVKAHLDELQAAAGALGLAPQARVLSGEPVPALQHAMDRGGYDLLVLVHDGTPRDRGSVTAELIADCAAPVLVFHAGRVRPELDRPRRLDSVLVTVDTEDDRSAPIRAAHRITLGVGGKMRVGTILKERGIEPAVDGSTPLLPPVPAGRVADAEAAHLKLVALCNGIGANHAGVSVAAAADPAAGLVALAIDAGVDAIVAAPHARGAIARLLLGSVTRRLIDLSPLPVMVISERAAQRFGPRSAK